MKDNTKSVSLVKRESDTKEMEPAIGEEEKPSLAG